MRHHIECLSDVKRNDVVVFSGNDTVSDVMVDEQGVCQRAVDFSETPLARIEGDGSLFR